MPANNKDKPFEWKLGYLMPAFFVVGALVNLGVSSSLGLTLSGFNALSLHSINVANYGIDAFDLAFAPVDPAIISEIAGQADTDNSGATEPTAIPLPSSAPTSPPLLDAPTIEVPDVAETVGTIVDDTLDIVGDTLETLLPQIELPTLPRLFP